MLSLFAFFLCDATKIGSWSKANTAATRNKACRRIRGERSITRRLVTAHEEALNYDRPQLKIAEKCRAAPYLCINSGRIPKAYGISAASMTPAFSCRRARSRQAYYPKNPTRVAYTIIRGAYKPRSNSCNCPLATSLGRSPQKHRNSRHG